MANKKKTTRADRQSEVTVLRVLLDGVVQIWDQAESFYKENSRNKLFKTFHKWVFNSNHMSQWPHRSTSSWRGVRWRGDSAVWRSPPEMSMWPECNFFWDISFIICRLCIAEWDMVWFRNQSIDRHDHIKSLEIFACQFCLLSFKITQSTLLWSEISKTSKRSYLVIYIIKYISIANAKLINWLVTTIFHSLAVEINRFHDSSLYIWISYALSIFNIWSFTKCFIDQSYIFCK